MVAPGYFDASAPVKLVAEDAGSDAVVDLWGGCDPPVSSRLAWPEARAALVAADWHHDLAEGAPELEEQVWDQYGAAPGPVERRGGLMARPPALGGASAVRLAGALAVGEADLVRAVWCPRLQTAAPASHLRVAVSRQGGSAGGAAARAPRLGWGARRRPTSSHGGIPGSQMHAGREGTGRREILTVPCATQGVVSSGAGRRVLRPSSGPPFESRCRPPARRSACGGAGSSWGTAPARSPA